MTVEVVCFEKDHRYVKSEHGEGYVCQNCRNFISSAEFEKRANTRLQADGLTPLALCGICGTWHTPTNFKMYPSPAAKA